MNIPLGDTWIPQLLNITLIVQPLQRFFFTLKAYFSREIIAICTQIAAWKRKVAARHESAARIFCRKCRCHFLKSDSFLANVRESLTSTWTQFSHNFFRETYYWPNLMTNMDGIVPVNQKIDVIIIIIISCRHTYLTEAYKVPTSKIE